MSKRTAVIDIGSNSARLVIYEKSSRYGFHLICEQKSRVRIGEGAYENGGYLQPLGMNRAYLALETFIQTIQKYKVHKTLCVATSALRDAPNAKDFISLVKKNLSINIKVISGDKEARYGALSASNLLGIHSAISIDIGGGSCDVALIENGNIKSTYSLNIGTVRLKELFFDKDMDIEEINKEAKKYIAHELKKLPKDFKSDTAIGIGGTARALAKGIMKTTEYPFDKLHAFEYEFKKEKSYLKAISKSSIKKLKEFNLKKNRYDTIREGCLIYYEILKHLDIKKVVTSSVGVREGVFLEQLLKHDNYRFPKQINPSITSLLDRFPSYIKDSKAYSFKQKIATRLYTQLQTVIEDKLKYKKELLYACKLSGIGDRLTIYDSHQHAFYIAQQELNYSFTHKEIVTISMLLYTHSKDLIDKELYKRYKDLLPSEKKFEWLSFIFTITQYLYEVSHKDDIEFNYIDKTLYIKSNHSLYLCREDIATLKKPIEFDIIIEDIEKSPF